MFQEEIEGTREVIRDVVAYFCETNKLDLITIFEEMESWHDQAGRKVFGLFAKAGCHFDHPYRDPHIHLTLDQDPDIVIAVLIHELIHYWQYAGTTEEQLISYDFEHATSPDYWNNPLEIEARSFTNSLMMELFEVYLKQEEQKVGEE